jgi:polysaccharide pyruvyl transferase WcaK-like protein
VHGQVLDWMIEKYDVEVLCLPLEITSLAEDDYFFCQEITKRMTHQDKVKIVNVRTLEAFKTYLATLDMLISSRMHPLVLAASEMIPTLVVAYDHKQTGFLHQLGLDYCAIDINEIYFEKMLQKAELVWNDKEKIRAHLQKVIPMLQNDVRTKIENVCIRFLPNE